MLSSVSFLLLFHGEMVLGLMASFLLALIVFPAAAFWLWLRPPRVSGNDVGFITNRNCRIC